MNELLTKKFLYNEYWKNGKSIKQISKELRCGYGTVYNYLVKFKIKRRSVSESTSGKRNHNFGKKFSQETIDKIRKAKIGNKYKFNFSGGRMKNGAGYIQIYTPKHPFANNNGYVKEHRLAIEEYLKRYLKPEEKTHHINRKKNDNKLSNLMLFSSHSAHVKFEKGSEIKLKEIIFDGGLLKL